MATNNTTEQSLTKKAVSYTHLDAIIIGFQGGYFHLLREKTGQNIQLYYKDFYACSYEPVSYTHLDVYKRQIYYLYVITVILDPLSYF